MTDAVFYEDSYLRTLSAEVTVVDAESIELSRTIFYPNGGGQPGDTGTFTSSNGEEYAVVDTRKGAAPGTIVHHLSSAEHNLKVNDEVTTTLDWERRYRLMRMHTGLHVMASLIPVMVTGGSVGAEKSRLDFDLGDYQIDKDDLNQRLTELISSAKPVSIESILEEDLDKNPQLVRTMSVQPPRGTGSIRMIRIEDIDYQPCGGTHLRNISEIGKARVSKIENKGKRNRRVHLVLDP
jgi:misacylated tRNA(Ala) deacylase